MKKDIRELADIMNNAMEALAKKSEEVAKAWETESDNDLWFKRNYAEKLLIGKDSVKLFNGDYSVHYIKHEDPEDDTVYIETDSNYYTIDELKYSTQHALANIIAEGEPENE